MTPFHVFALVILAATGSEPDVRADAWDRSVTCERAGDLVEAERIVIQAWGAQTDNYWAALRLAYLALLQERYGEATRRYRGLLDRREAEHDADVGRGYAAAVSGLAVGKSALLRPELWGIATGHALGVYRSSGWGLYAQLPVRLSQELVLRAAGRFISMETRSTSRWARTGPTDAWSIDEEYVSLAWNRRPAGIEVVAARSGITDQNTILGGGARLRLGSDWGVVLGASFLRAGSDIQNTQLVPSAFVWPLPTLVLQAGTRVTLDERGNGLSGTASVTVIVDALTIAVRGHVGPERWAFGFDGPSILSFDSQTTYGGSATVAWLAGDALKIFLQGDGARLSDQGAFGSYWSASVGLQYAIHP